VIVSWRWLVVATCALAALVTPDRAVGGTYTVRACWGDESGGWQAFPDPQRGLDTRRACPWTQHATYGSGIFALATKRGFGAGMQSGWTFAAPSNTHVVGFSAYSASAPDVTRPVETMWQRGLWNGDTGAMIAPASLSTEWTYTSAQGFSASRVGLGLRCFLAQCGPVIWNLSGGPFDDWVSFIWVTLTLRDDVKPSIVVTQDVPSGWQGQSKAPFSFTATDDVGIALMHVYLDDSLVQTFDRRCYDPAVNTVVRPCSDPAPPFSFALDPATIPHGRHVVSLRALDAAGNIARQDRSLLVDHNAPAAPRALTLRDGASWRSENRFEVSWTRPPAGDESPIGTAEYELCPALNAPYDDSGCRRGHSDGDDISRISDLEVPGDGEWRLRLSLRDTAGNGDQDRAATIEGLKLDTMRPTAAFLPFDPLDPTRIRLRTSDATSGIASAEIEARRRGEALWRSLGVDGSGGSFSTVIDDERLPDGRYELRARVVDVAGNERTTTALESGAAAEVVLPARVATTLEVGRSTRVRIAGSRGKRPRYRRVLVGRPEADYGDRVSLQGRLTDEAGNPRANGAIEVLERVDLPGLEWRPVATVRTGASGAFTFRAPPGPARVLQFRYPGTATARPGSDEVELRVRAGVRLVPSRDRLRNGQSVVFRGRLLGRPIPAEGKLLALQAMTSRGWRTFATPRARGQDGRWVQRYRFTGTSATARYAFRVVVPREAGYPYAQGFSPTAHVLVRGD
jgi:hypothetical protein